MTQDPKNAAAARTALIKAGFPEDAPAEVLAAVKILEREHWQGARWGDPEARGFFVESDGRGGVRVYSYLKGLQTDALRAGEKEFTETRLSGYAFALHAAGWASDVPSSYSVRATPPPPAVEASEAPAPVYRYAWQVQTCLLGGEWLDVGRGGVDLSEKRSPQRFAAWILGREKLPPITEVREVRVMVWDLTRGGDPVEVHDTREAPDQT